MVKFGILLNDKPNPEKGFSGLLVAVKFDRKNENLELIEKDFGLDGKLEGESGSDIVNGIEEIIKLRDFLNSLKLEGE